jgi:hypothetical protein
MPAYPFLDSTAEHLIEQDHGLWVYCRCGRHVHMTPEKTFIPLRHLTLFQILGRLRCSGCGKLGDIEGVTVSPMASAAITGGVTGR